MPPELTEQIHKSQVTNHKSQITNHKSQTQARANATCTHRHTRTHTRIHIEWHIEYAQNAPPNVYRQISSSFYTSILAGIWLWMDDILDLTTHRTVNVGTNSIHVCPTTCIFIQMCSITLPRIADCKPTLRRAHFLDYIPRCC